MSRGAVVAWQSTVLMCTIVLALIVPIHLVIPNLVAPSFVPLMLVISAIYLADLINAYRRHKRKGAPYFQRYLRQWLIIDLVSVLPYALIFNWPWLSLLQFLKILHVGSRINERIRESPRFASILRLSHFAYIILTILNWVACSRAYLHPMPQYGDMGYYLHSLYWATTALANAGLSGDEPTSNIDLVFAVTTMLTGLVMYGYLIGNIASLLNKIDPARVHHEETLEKVHAFIRYRNLPPELEHRINSYYAYVWEKRLGYDETSVLAALPPGLKTEVSMYLKREVLERVNIFRDASEEFIREISIFLHAQIVMPGDYVFKIGDTARSMYFISKGAVEVLSGEGEVLSVLHEGEFFGEMALIRKRKRNASVRALVHSDLYVLDVASFERILAEHAEFKNQIEDVVKERTAF